LIFVFVILLHFPIQKLLVLFRKKVIDLNNTLDYNNKYSYSTPKENVFVAIAVDIDISLFSSSVISVS